MLACAIGDAYGAGFEYILPLAVRTNNHPGAGYRQHPKWPEMKPGYYTDDTQMALALAEHLIEDGELNHLALAERWVMTFKRDERTGYAGGFYKLLQEVDDGLDLIQRIRPTSDKNGGAMRAFPIGFLENIHEVRDLAMLQASVTHGTWPGMTAAAGAALMFHYCYHELGPRSDLPQFLGNWLPGVGFHKPWKGKVGSFGPAAVRAALTALVNHDSLGDVLQACVAYTGDTDTVAAIAMPAAAVCKDMAKTLPKVLYDTLENGTYGRDYLQGLDQTLAEKFPRAAHRRKLLQEARKAKREALVLPEPPKGVPLIDFLFGEEEGE